MDKHPLAGKTVKLTPAPCSNEKLALSNGALYRIEDYWINVSGGSWMDAQGNPACLMYAMRAGFSGLPIDDNVVYGKIGGLGHLVHVNELGDVVEER